MTQSSLMLAALLDTASRPDCFTKHKTKHRQAFECAVSLCKARSVTRMNTGSRMPAFAAVITKFEDEMSNSA